ncbi:MAG: hypothetical protein IT276_15495 [Ignavibacteriaceae bacterium]|nr:hypothetical protein [Ignavibacteriaceae bacterium]
MQNKITKQNKNDLQKTVKPKVSSKENSKPLIGAFNAAGAVAEITTAIVGVVDTWTREAALTERVRIECRNALALAREKTKELEIKKDAWEKTLKERSKDRKLLTENLNKYWKNVEIWDKKFDGLDFEEMKTNRELLNDYMNFKTEVLKQITDLMKDYYKVGPAQQNLIGNK